MPSANDVVNSLLSSFAKAKLIEKPYRHWFVDDCLPRDVVDEVLSLPYAVAELDGVSGKRDLHNATRRYFDVEGRETHACVAAVAEALQDSRVTTVIQKTFGLPPGEAFLRVEYAQDVDGFWLEPHTDIGVKVFTFLLYISKNAAHAELGTDIYDRDKQWVGRSPFRSDSGMIFVPSTITYHGFERRPIEGVRKSLVINYVTHDWRAREQLAFPDEPVTFYEQAPALERAVG